MNDLDKALMRLLYIETIGMMVFGVVVALGKVHPDSSYGLPEILHTIELLTAGTLGIIAGRYSSGKKEDKQ